MRFPRTHKSTLPFAVLVIGALLLAACAPAASGGYGAGPVATSAIPVTGENTPVGAGGLYGSPAAGEPTLAATQAGSASAAPETLKVASDATLGSFLTDAAGMTLYTYTLDTPGVTNCYTGCVPLWQPLVVSAAPEAASGVSGQIALITRKDGMQQVTYNGLALYTFSGDKNPGDVKGQGFENEWYVVQP